MFNYLVNYFKALVPQKSKKGQAMVEYALIIALIAIVLIAGLNSVEGGISAAFTRIASAVTPAAAPQ